MRKSELTDKLARRLGVKRDNAFLLLSSVVDVINESLAQGNEVRLTGLGKFTPGLRGGLQKKDFFRGGRAFVTPYVKVNFIQFSASKYELLNANLEMWKLVAKQKGRTFESQNPTG